MSYNFLRDAKNISNSTLCKYDSIHGYATDFSNNGDVNGWNIYNNIYMYGVWNNVLFGSSYLNKCYISRTEVFLSVNAEEYFFIEFILKVIDENPDRAIKGLNKGKIMWLRSDDNDWDEDRSLEFDITGVGTWEYYKINLGPQRWWQGDVNNLRFYPFIDGHYGDKFFIKSLKITSEDVWACNNTNCSYYQNYTHPCPGAGDRAYCEALSYKPIYTTLSGISSDLIVNIDNYGDEHIDLGTNHNITGRDLSRVMSNSISTVNIGGYAFVEVSVTDNDTLRISSGTTRSDSSVHIAYSNASVELGFYLADGTPNFTLYYGKDPATGFDYASTRLLQAFEINSLLDGSSNIAYVHNPAQYSVEGGRRDFNEIGISKLVSELSDAMGYMSFDNNGKTLVDLSKRIDNNGKLTHFWVYGINYENASFKVLRPHNDGSLTVIYTELLPQEDPELLYTVNPIVSRLECDILVNKGDLLGVYNVDVYVGQVLTSLPDATFTQYPGDITGTVPKTTAYSYGVGGFSIYARGDLKQQTTILDIDLGYRLNVSEVVVAGEELEGFFEFNIASCLDTTWTVDLFGESHDHYGKYLTGNGGSWHDVHTNIYYGKECLDDLVVTADNGQAGDVYGQDNGLSTLGPHAYFYVNGDTEWLYSTVCNGRTEYCGVKFPSGGAANYITDPVALTMYFPADRFFDVHKCILYFKEENNFRNIAISTFEGPECYTGDADRREFNLVPEIKKVFVNGTAYSLGDDNDLDKYLFKNPATSDIFPQDFDNYELVSDFISTNFVDWTILGQEFEPVACRGFRYYCNKHYSTKITEAEVYSRIPNDVSMVDNVVLYFSDYGETWRTTGLKTRDERTSYAFIGGTPRYFRITLDSQTKFNMRELALSVTNQAKTEDSLVLLDHTRNGQIGEGKPIKIQNIYDKPFDLTVDIPRDLITQDNIIFWNKLSSDKDLTDTVLGPSCNYYKNEDFPITYYRGQCANECYGYSLANLIDNKKAYYTYNTFDWYFFDTLKAGTQVLFNNYEYLYYSKFSSSFPVVSSKYWQFYILATDQVIKIKDIICYHQGTRKNIRNVLIPYTSKITDTAYIVSDGVSVPQFTNFIDSFSSGDTSDFSISGVSGFSYNTSNGYLSVNTLKQPSTLRSHPLPNNSDFEFFLDYMIDEGHNYLNGWIVNFSFYEGNYEVFYIKLVVPAVTMDYCTNPGTKLEVYADDVLVSTVPSVGCHFFVNTYNKMTIRKAKGTVTLLVGDDIVLTTFNIDSSKNIDAFSFSTNDKISNYNIYRIQFDETLLLAPDSWFGLELSSNEPFDTLHLIATGTALELDVYTSYNNLNYTLSSALDVVKHDLHASLAIDLELRHALAIIRNYGNVDLFDLSLQLNTLFSNTSGSIEEAQFVSSEKDCRWLNILSLCSDGIPKVVDYLGVYSDIEVVYCQGGGLNNKWLPLVSDLTSYIPSTNISPMSTVHASTYYRNAIPQNAIDGRVSTYDISYCWGYEEGTVPVLYIEFGAEYHIGAITMYNGYDPTSTQVINKAYKFSLDNTVSGTDYSYEEAVNVIGITDARVRTHEFDYVYARRAKLEILEFSTMTVYNDEDLMDAFLYKKVGFLRGIDVLHKPPTNNVNSEDTPIICFNLRDRFNIVNHVLYNDINSQNNDPDSLNNYDWDNNDEFFSYSDSLLDDPNKVPFFTNLSKIVEFETTKDSLSQIGYYQYLVGSAVFLSKGYHTVDWQAYYPEGVEEISLVIFSTPDIVLFAYNLGTGYLDQKHVFFIPEDGYFNIYAMQNIDIERPWGVRNVQIYRQYDLTKWVAIRRDTATNYSYDFTPEKYGKDYLSKIELFGSEHYVPTEYYWWWDTTISTLGNDPINTKVGSKSLVVDYPPSTSVDTVKLKEADHFGRDWYWSIQDSLHFYLFIDNVNNLDVTYGSVLIGSYGNNSKKDFYYSWDLSSLSLSTGWNEINLNFYDYDAIYPTSINTTSLNHMLEADIQSNGVNISTLYIQYRGVGNALRMLIDGFRIKRNRFDTIVKHGKGLCLTYTDYLEVPLSNVTLDRGTVEFWVKMGVNTLSMNSFGTMHAATLFTLSSNTNDIIALRIKPGNWFEIFAGNIRKQSLFNVTDLPGKSYIDIDSIIHIALVWSNDGSKTDSGHTMKLYINGEPTLTSFTPWEVSDTKHSYFKLGGGIAQTAQIHNNHSAFVYENLKIYNYCKTDFDINKQDIESEYLYAAENFIEISKNDIDYFGLGSDKLPFFFEQVPSLGSETVYVRTVKTSSKRSNNSTAQIIIDWLTTI